MNKRSAMTVAAGLVIALLAGLVALSLGISGAGTSGATQEPRVRTIERTVTIDRRARNSEQVAGSVETGQPAMSVRAADELGDDEGFEDEDDRDPEDPEDEEEDDD